MVTRRGFLKGSALAAGTIALARMPVSLAGQNPRSAPPLSQPNNLLQTMRTAAASTPIQTTKVTDTIFLLQGVGGNMVAQIGPDGKLLVDSSMATASHALQQVLSKLGANSLKLLINTCWLFDHTDGNAALHDAGVFIIAQENTRVRLSSPQKMPLLNLSLNSAPNGALPQLTFTDSDKLYFNNDQIQLVYVPNAQTDSDIFVHWINANVIHTGDLYHNGSYPLIDAGSGGTINGLIRGVDQVLDITDDRTRIVPGHGPPGNKASLQKYRDMLAAVANRIEKMKIAGRSLDQVLVAKPTADLDAAWGRGPITPEIFVTGIYSTL
ncbi:MAG TPA: MBL fold metallo-hydrolase [Silvibacterium sp.]|nr:MBL fold metallo-hydrolase [Silvibacterium sp.]